MIPSNKKPFFSLILPTYNVELYIEKCIKSILNQSYKNFEVIFVDDCGKDNSINIIKEWKKIDDRINIIQNPKNLGTFESRKKGFEAAKGNYIFFLDPDDSILPESLLKINKEINKSPSDLIIYGIEEINKTKKNYIIPKFKKNTVKKNILYILFNNIKNFHPGNAGKLYSHSLLKKTYEKLSYIEERLIYGEDQLLLFTAASLSKNLLIINDFFYCYNINQNSITIQKDYNSINIINKQLTTIINHIETVSNESEINKINKKKSIQKTKNKIINNLIYAKEIRNRYLIDPKTNKSLYFTSVKNVLKAQPNIKNLLRIIIYIFTFKKVKL